MKVTRKKIDELRLFTRKIRAVILFLILAVSTTPHLVFGQQKITSKDETIIRRKVLEITKILEERYNQILNNADPIERNDLIDGMFIIGNRSIFRDDQVFIEDDFQTRINVSNDITTKKVEIYFKDLAQQYGRGEVSGYSNEGKEIKFKNILIDKLMATANNAPLFMRVYFELVYDGIDSRTKLPYKQPSSRVAEIQIERNNNIWQCNISTIRFRKLVEDDFSKNVIIEKVADSQERGLMFVEEEKKIVFQNQNILLRAFRSGEKWGIKNAGTDEILANPSFDYIDDYSTEGVAAVNLGGLWGYIDIFGKIIIDCKYDVAEPFGKEKKGKAKVQMGVELFFIDKIGNRTK